MELKAKGGRTGGCTKTNMKSITAATKNNNNVEIQQCVSNRKARVVSASTADDQDRAALRREQLTDDVGQLLQQVEAGQLLELKDIDDQSPSYKSYWAQWKLLPVRNGMLGRQWESAAGRTRWPR
jgi:hypothetical protein